MAVARLLDEKGQIDSSVVLSIENLEARFGAVAALDGIDLDVRSGDLVGLAGENGAGKTTLVRCVVGDIAPTSGVVRFLGRPVVPDPTVQMADGIAVVWQDLSLCDNLDVAANLLLGREPSFFLGSERRLHARAAAILKELRVPLSGTAASVATLSGGQRQLLAIARAVRDRPRLLILDEPTGALGVNETAEVERLIVRLREQGVTIILVSHDLEQLFRIADRVIVMRAGRVVGDVDPSDAHTDDVVALMSGQRLDQSPRGQLTRLHGLVERLASTDHSSSLSLILSTLGAALRVERLSVHVVEHARLRCVASLGLDPRFLAAWRELELGAPGGPVGLAASTRRPVTSHDRRSGAVVGSVVALSARFGIASSWAMPIIGADGVLGVISVLRTVPGEPDRDERELLSLYASYAANALERDRLFGQVTARNVVLETIRDVLETLTGPAPVDEAFAVSLRSLCDGLGAVEVGLVCQPRDDDLYCRAAARRPVEHGARATASLLKVAGRVLGGSRRDGLVRFERDDEGHPCAAISFAAPEAPTALVARFGARDLTFEVDELMKDASHSFRLALEREEVGLAHQEAAGLRRARELQRDFLSRLSHELRTPLTAIRGYASSLMQEDVSWDRDSERRFLGRVVSESARLGRLVDDLLDFSAIESGVMRLQRDWCSLPLLLAAAAECLPPAEASQVSIDCEADLPVIWADHDRLEQVFLNLMDNAIRHNPAGTRVDVRSTLESPASVLVEIVDNGRGIAPDALATLYEPSRRHRTPAAGIGLGLSISRSIVVAHGGSIELEQAAVGTHFCVRLPVEAELPASEDDVDDQPS